MDTQSTQPNKNKNKNHMNKTLRKTLTILNCLLLMLGNTGGPCLSRLYFNHGGHRNWLLSFLETAGFPILLIPLIISYYYRRSSNPSTRAYFTTPHIYISCAIVGLLTGLDDFLYAYVALLTVGSVILGLHRNSDRPANVTKGKYIMGFILTLGTAALYGLVLPLIELTYMKAKQVVTYTLVMEMQVIMGFFATPFCFVGMLINHDFSGNPRGSKAV
ncbi:Purine permease plant protein [Dioscorea alata]|uniref:Purine permease plant protein n=1 Tax=Dioscorea alata TaxID=55571 RepID=A0ACB7U5G8_DIOAL|nr:Purine permease plant protein [Dioscorea alata]